MIVLVTWRLNFSRFKTRLVQPFCALSDAGPKGPSGTPFRSSYDVKIWWNDVLFWVCDDFLEVIAVMRDIRYCETGLITGQGNWWEKNKCLVYKKFTGKCQSCVDQLESAHIMQCRNEPRRRQNAQFVWEEGKILMTIVISDVFWIIAAVWCKVASEKLWTIFLYKTVGHLFFHDVLD